MANIIVHTQYNQVLGKIESQTYEWEGEGEACLSTWRMEDELKRFGCDPSKIKVGDTIRLGGLSLIAISDPQDMLFVMYGNIAVILDDGPFSRLRAYAIGLRRPLEIAYRRLIITLAVWRLASCEEGQLPSWRDIYALKKLERLFK